MDIRKIKTLIEMLEDWEIYYNEMENLAKRLMSVFAISLNLKANYFNEGLKSTLCREFPNLSHLIIFESEGIHSIFFSNLKPVLEI